MKKILTIILAIATFGVAIAEEDYIEYSIPKDADKYGPIATRESEVTYTKYFRKGSDVENDKSLIGVEYHRNGILTKRELYKEGKLHGMQKRRHHNGQLEVEAPYKQGFMHGVFKHWDSQGQLVGKYLMHDGSGVRLLFQDNGVIGLVDSYVDNLREGWYIELYKNGFLEVVNKATKGEFVSKSSAAFHDTGNLYLIGITSDKGAINNGILVYFEKDGKYRESFFYLNGSKVAKDQYLKASQDNKKIPLLLENPQDYKKHLNEEIVRLIDEYEKLEKVKIPLEFNEDGSIVTLSGNTFVLPK